jgi:serine/threonine protein kinase
VLSPGQNIDRYVVEALIGSGGTAMVYRVRHRQLSTWHALKVLSVTSAAIRDRMLREGRVQAELRHLNIVAVTDILDIDGSPGLLLEFIDGPSLEDALREYTLELEDGELLFVGIVSGVRHAHQHGLVHRDLKPANVLLARTDKGYVPKVTDFGLAKILQGDAEMANTRHGIAMGTPHYMAPEQIRDARNVDQRADLFSLGCLLYELATGERTFPGDEALAIYNAITHGEYVLPTDLRPDLPDRFDLAIRGCLIVDPNKRIPDCSVLLEVLRGERGWDVPEAKNRSHDDDEVTSRQAPSPRRRMSPQSIAPRPPGQTPAPAPQRLMASTGPTAEVDAGNVAEENAGPTEDPFATVAGRALPSNADGTLGAQDSLEPRRSPILLVAMLGVALFFALLGFGAIATIGALYIGTTQVGSAPVPAIAAPVAPPPVQAPPKADVTPVAAPAPESAPKVEVAPVKPADAPKKPDPLKAAAKPADHPEPKPDGKVDPKPEVKPAVKPPEAVVSATVKILTQPPTAIVLIDGAEAKGRSPVKLELAPGSHQVEVKSGDQSGRFSIAVTADGENRWCWSFSDNRAVPGSCSK